MDVSRPDPAHWSVANAWRQCRDDLNVLAWLFAEQQWRLEVWVDLVERSMEAMYADFRTKRCE